MKLSTSLIFALAASTTGVSSASFLKTREPESKNSKAQVIIQGVKTDFSDEDLVIISKSVIAAYNSMQDGSGFVVEGAQPLIHFGTSNLGQHPRGGPDYCYRCAPDDDATTMTMNYVLLDTKVSKQPLGRYTGGGHTWCYRCAPDDDSMLGSVDNHEKFVNAFCDLLVESGSTNLKDAKGCSFTFLEDPGYKVAPLAIKETEEESALGYFEVQGLLHEMSAEDIKIVEAATISAYNEAFATLGHSMEELNTHGAAKVPSSKHGREQSDNSLTLGQHPRGGPDYCYRCAPDDDSITNQASAVLFDAKLGQTNGRPDWCYRCAPADDSMATEKDIEKINSAFNLAVCAKLRNSGSANLAYAEGCEMEFLYHHDGVNGGIVNSA